MKETGSPFIQMRRNTKDKYTNDYPKSGNNKFLAFIES